MSKLSRVESGVYRYPAPNRTRGDVIIMRIKVEGEPLFWQATDSEGRNWLGNYPTLREARRAAAREVSR